MRGRCGARRTLGAGVSRTPVSSQCVPAAGGTRLPGVDRGGRSNSRLTKRCVDRTPTPVPARRGDRHRSFRQRAGPIVAGRARPRSTITVPLSNDRNGREPRSSGVGRSAKFRSVRVVGAFEVPRATRQVANSGGGAPAATCQALSTARSSAFGVSVARNTTNRFATSRSWARLTRPAERSVSFRPPPRRHLGLLVVVARLPPPPYPPASTRALLLRSCPVGYATSRAYCLATR